MPRVARVCKVGRGLGRAGTPAPLPALLPKIRARIGASGDAYTPLHPPKKKNLSAHPAPAERRRGGQGAAEEVDDVPEGAAGVLAARPLPLQRHPPRLRPAPPRRQRRRRFLRRLHLAVVSPQHPWVPWEGGCRGSVSSAPRAFCCPHRQAGRAGSAAVCVYSQEALEEVFEGKYKELNKESSRWTVYSGPHISPRPGSVSASCPGTTPPRFPSSSQCARTGGRASVSPTNSSPSSPSRSVPWAPPRIKP